MSDQERWLVLSVEAADEQTRGLLAEGLLALGGVSVLEQGDFLITFLPPPEDPDAFVADAGPFLADWLLRADPPPLRWSWHADEDWSREWKRGLAPRKVSPRIVVRPSWTTWDAAPGEVVLEIDPEMAFGTGEHATTRGCLRLLDTHLRPGDRTLDVGSGSAVLAIAAARLGAGEVIAVEYDPDANLNARDNLTRNGVEGGVQIVEAMADEPLLEKLGPFDLILANILSSVIRPLLPAFRRSLNPGGRLIVSGILRSEQALVLVDAETEGYNLIEVDEEEEWWSAILSPRSPRPEEEA